MQSLKGLSTRDIEGSTTQSEADEQGGESLDLPTAAEWFVDLWLIESDVRR
jgi:hypothetical protein